MSDKDWQALIDTLRDGDASELAAAASRLHKSATSVDVPRLINLLDDDDFFVRERGVSGPRSVAGITRRLSAGRRRRT